MFTYDTVPHYSRFLFYIVNSSLRSFIYSLKERSPGSIIEYIRRIEEEGETSHQLIRCNDYIIFIILIYRTFHHELKL